MRLIDADTVLKDIEALKMSPWYNANYLSEQRHLGMKEGMDMADACVRYATEVEAIPVIRCKDCKFSMSGIDKYNERYILCQLHERSYGVIDDGFCSWAERKEG